jgi:F-type H+-transporting ATPase subunit b
VLLEPYAVLAVIAIVLMCTVTLNALVFRPVLGIIEQRQRAVTDARELAESSAQKAQHANAEYDRTLAAARAEVYGQMDEKRRAALDKRTALLASTRAEVERELAAARQQVIDQAADARARLDREAGELAGAIVQRVLGRAS